MSPRGGADTAGGILGTGSQATRAVRVALADVFKPEALLYSLVQLVGVRILSVGKISVTKGKGKDKGKDKGKGKDKAKGNSKGKGKDKAKSTIQACQPVYFGDSEGHVICSLAYDDDVKKIPARAPPYSLVNVSAMKPRVGQLGVL